MASTQPPAANNEASSDNGGDGGLFSNLMYVSSR